MSGFVLHRANTLYQAALPLGFSGAEIDLRIYLGKIVLAHDPFQDGVALEEWLPQFTGDFLILNTKESGIETYVSQILDSIAPDIDYVFLDLVIPSLIAAAQNRLPIMVRISEYEPFAAMSNISSKWIWVDSFSGDWQHLFKLPTATSQFSRKVCLVSPELQGRFPESNPLEFTKLKSFIRDNPDVIDLICTKDRSFWIE